MADCAYTFTGPDGKPLTIVGVPGLKAYLVDGGLEHLFPERKFPLKAVAQISRGEEPAEKPTRKNTFQNQAEAEEHLLQSFGPGIKNLISSKVLNFTQGKDSWPEKVQRQLRGGEEAVYVNGKAYIDLQAIGKDRLNAVVLHEIGEHFNLKLMLGPEGYKSLQDQITNRAKIKGSQAEKIWNQVERLYPDLEVGSEAFVSEVIAKLGEANPQAPWYRRLLTRIKAFLVERGLGRGFITSTMTEDDMHDLLRTSLMSAAGRFAQGEARVFGGLDLTDGIAAFSKRTRPDPIKTVTAYKLFRVKKSKPGQLFPLFVNATTPVEIGSWEDADIGELTDKGKVKSKIGPLAYRPGWRSGDVPVATHIGVTKVNGKVTERGDDMVWAEVEVPADIDWQPEADSRASIVKSGPNAGQINKAEAHITDQIPTDGFYRYKTSSNMTGNWLISGSMKVVRVLTDEEVKRINDAQGVADLPRATPLDLRKYGFDAQGYPLEKGKFSRPIENLQPAPEERTPLWNRWFGKSKMQRGGEPIKFYHGSQAEFTVFDKSRLATNTTHTTAGLGHFFTMRKEEAKSYGGNVKEVFLSIQKPYVTFSWSLDSKFKDAAGAAKFREKLQAEGYDGVFIKDAGYAVTFESNQAKLTENERPTFGEDVRFSRIDDADTIQESAKDLGAQLKEKFRKMSSGLMAQRFAFLSVRQMVEQAKDYLTNVPEYEYNMQERRAEVDRWLIKGDRVVSEYWKKLSKASRKALSDVIHNSTLSDVDASKAWSGMEELKGDKGQATGIMRVYTQAQLSNENQKWLDSLVRDNGGTIAAASGRGYVDIMKVNWDKAEGVLVELQARELAQTKTRAANRWKDENPARKQSHTKLQSDFNALPDQAKFVYSEANKLHNEMFNARMKALEAQINDAILDVATRTKLNKELRQRMESQSLAWYYAPLSRHGNHWFYGVDDKGTKWFRTFEHEKGRDEAMKQFLSENQIRGEILGSGTSLSEKKGTLGSEVSDSFIREINEAISRNVPSEEGIKLQDAIYQMYIDTLPDVSVRHSAMHRKGVLGFDEDAMRSFSHAIHHGASQLSNMLYGRKMEDVLNEAEEGLEVASSSNQRGLREAEIEAIKLLQEDWDTLSEEGYIESQLRKFVDGEEDEDLIDDQYADVSEDVWAKMKAMRNKFGRLDEDARDEAFERHVDKINRVLDIASHIKHEDKSKAAAVISELRKTYKAMVATGSSDMDQVAAYIRQGNFIWTLGFSFSGGMINMLQTPVVAMPIAYGKYGMSKTVAEFNRSRNEFIKAATEGLKRDKKGNFLNRDDDGNVSISVGIERKLENTAYGTPEHEMLRDELEAISLFKESGDISRTQTFELIGVGQQGEEHGGKLQDFAKWAGWGFHFGERANREITLMAAYRLARSTGATHDEAIAAARQLNNTAHGDYSSENAARIFRGWPAQIALQYKKYVQMQLYLWGSTAMNAIRLINDRSSKEGREAARTLGGLFVMQSAFAGMMGLPLMGMASAIINAIGGIFDDEDEPFNVEEEIRVWLAQNFGETWATAVMKGGLNALTPVNIGDRLSLRDVVFRDPMVELEGRDAATNMLASLFGPTGGTIQRLYESGKLLNDGEVLRAAENATPKFISDVFKAGRYFSEDARSLNHQMLKEMTTMENLFQLAGFSSSALEVKYAERGMTKKREANIGEYRKKLINDAVRAEEEGEYFDWSVIEDFNEKYPTKAIVPDSIRKSEERRAEYEERSEDRGYAIDPKLEFLYEEYDLDESE